jgi:hypothetical protein
MQPVYVERNGIEMKFAAGFIYCLALLIMWPGRSAADTGGVAKERFGETADGRPLYLYTLTNANGMRATIMNYGGIMVSLHVPDRNGALDDVVLGYANLADTSVREINRISAP